jgi:hypothetical protein
LKGAAERPVAQQQGRKAAAHLKALYVMPLMHSISSVVIP